MSLDTVRKFLTTLDSNRHILTICSTSRSYATQLRISADGKLQSPLYLVLKEPCGKFGPIVQETIFQPIITFSHKIKLSASFNFTNYFAYRTFSEVVGKCFLPECRAEKRVSHSLRDWTLPRSCTASNTGWKEYNSYDYTKRRHFSDSVILLDYDLNLHIRNNIIKLQSLVHNQSFFNTLCEIPGGQNVAVIRTSWCKKPLF